MHFVGDQAAVLSAACYLARGTDAEPATANTDVAGADMAGADAADGGGITLWAIAVVVGAGLVVTLVGAILLEAGEGPDCGHDMQQRLMIGS